MTLVDVIVATAAVVCAGIAFTVWRFKPTAAHDHATTEQLKHFFEGKACAICKRPIPPVHLTGGLKPGLMNPKTHETYSWEEIPNANLPAVLETHVALCSACEVAESLRRRFPDRVVDGDQSLQDAH